MPELHRGVLCLLAFALCLALASPAAAQAGRKTLNQVSQLLLSAHKLLNEENDTRAARAECEKARAIEEKAKDPFIAATVQMCFGDVADYEENADAACRHYAEALKHFRAVPTKHSARRTVHTHMNVTEGKRLTLACGA